MWFVNVGKAIWIGWNHCPGGTVQKIMQKNLCITLSRVPCNLPKLCTVLTSSVHRDGLPELGPKPDISLWGMMWRFHTLTIYAQRLVWKCCFPWQHGFLACCLHYFALDFVYIFPMLYFLNIWTPFCRVWALGRHFVVILWSLRLRDNAFICTAPPCSLMGPACASVHRRTWDAPQGDLKNFKVRLSNRIFMNMALRIEQKQLFHFF